MASFNLFTLHNRRDTQDFSDRGPSNSTMGRLLFVLFILLLLASLCSLVLVMLRRRRLARKQGLLSPYPQKSHRRSMSISNFDAQARNESIFVYDEKMNLIHNSSSPPSAAIPEIHITFPDDEGNGRKNQNNRVVVVHITDSGSIGMEPLKNEKLPPYQQADADRFQSLDLERIGGLREKNPSGPTWS